MAEKPPKELIDKWVFDDNIHINVNSFDSRKHLFDFGIDSDLSLNENKAIPRLREQFHENRNDLDIDLTKGMLWAKNNNRLIIDLENYRKECWIHFLQCLQKHNTIVEEGPTFVAIDKIIIHLFSLIKTKSFFATQFRGVIYLFGYETLKMDKTRTRLRSSDYHLIRLVHLITYRNMKDMNAFERNMRVDKISLNDTTVVMCRTIQAIDRKMYPVYVRFRSRSKLQQVWTTCAISGIQTFVHGKKLNHPDESTSYQKNTKAILEGIKLIDVRDIRQRNSKKFFSYLDQSLKFIKHSVFGTELQLFEFTIDKKEKTLSCFRHETSDHFLPDFYTQ